MKKLFTLLIALVFGFLNIKAQCTIDNTCGGPYANVVICEVSGDSGQSDACEDAIVEICGPPGTMIGCMVVTDTEWAVLIPPGTVIPPDGVYMIGCSASNDFNCGVGISGQSGLIGAASPDACEGGGNEGDFNAGLLSEIDFDTCNPANASFYDPAASGFTLDNTGGPPGTNGDGEQVFLFLPDGTPWDGIFWDGGGNGTADHVSVSQLGVSYTLGDNDGNGIINDNAGTVGGGRGDGGNATAVPILPTDAACPCNTPTEPGTFTVPPVTDPIWYEWQTPNGDGDFVGCNSSFIRGPLSGGGYGGSPSHTDGLITSTAVDANGQPIDNGGGLATGTTGDAFTPEAYTPSSCGSSAAEWGYTDHPTPGQPNNDPAFVFYASETAICDLTTPITFTVEIYNYQNVSDGSVDAVLGGSSGCQNTETGSIVNNNGTIQTYDTYAVAGEQTTMTVTINSWNPGVNTVGLVWDDFSNGSGTQGDPTLQSNPNECYEEFVFKILAVEELIATDLLIECPAENPQGAIDASAYISGGANLTYELVDQATQTNVAGPQSSGVFLLNTDPTFGPYEIIVTDGSGCYPPVTIVVSDDCEQPPICPENFVTDIDGIAGPVTACPGDAVELCFNGDQLPPGGTITWQFSNDLGTTYNDIESFPIPEPTLVVEGYISQFTYDPGSVPAGCSDGQAWGGTDNAPEVVELVVTPLSDLSCYVLSDGEGAYVIPSGTLAPADGVIVICGDPCVAAAVPGGCDLIATSADLAGGSFILGNSGDQLIFMAPDGTILDEVAYTDGNDCIAQTVPPTNTVSGCTTNIGTSVTGGTPSPCSTDLTNTGLVLNATGTDFVNNGSDYGGFGTADGPGIAAPPGPSGYNSTPADMEFCATFTVPDDACPTATYDFQAVVDPFDSANCPVEAPDEADGIATSLQATVSCPNATLDLVAYDVCEADQPNVDVSVTIDGGAGPNYTVEYAIDGVSQGTVSIPNGGTLPIAGPTNGDVKVTLLSIVDEGGALCSGSVGDDEVCVNIRPTLDLTISTSSSPSICSPCDGTVTFDLSTGTTANAFDIEYSLDGAIFSVSSVSMPYTLTGVCPGTLDIVSAFDDSGCPMTVTSNEQTLTSPAGAPLTVSAEPAAICDDGTFDIDLSTDATYSPAFTTADFEIFDVDPNTLPSSALANTPSPLIFSASDVSTSTVISGVTANATYFVQFTDPGTGCKSVAPVNIVVDNSVCVQPVFDLALTKEVNTTATPGPFAPGDPVTYTICVYNQGNVDATATQVTDYGANTTTNAASDLVFVGLGSTPATTTQGSAVLITQTGAGIFEIDALAGGEDVCFDVDYTIDAAFAGTSIINDAEITADSDDDIDSIPGDNPTDAPDPDDDSTDDGNMDNTTQDPSDDDYDPAEVLIVQPCPAPSFTCPGANIDPCDPASASIVLAAVDLGTNGTSVTDGTWSGTGSFYINDQGTPAVADDVLEIDSTVPDGTYTLELTMNNNGCIATSVSCSFTVAKTCDADGGSFGN